MRRLTFVMVLVVLSGCQNHNTPAPTGKVVVGTAVEETTTTIYPPHNDTP